MSSLQALFEELVEKAPKVLLTGILKKKLQREGVELPEEVLTQLSAHILSGSQEKFLWDDGRDDRDFKLKIDAEDIQELEKGLKKFDDGLPNILTKAAKQIARTTLPDLRRKWPEEEALQFYEAAMFREGIDHRWGKALGKLRMLLTMARELGEIVIAEPERESDTLHGLMVRLHVRSCQVTTEIITLLENGLADGAMARWRTLHEIVIVMELLDQHGEPLAMRYLAHQAVESKAAMDQYRVCAVSLGYDALDEQDCIDIEEGYDEVIQRYGKFFRTPYGWAEGFVPKNSRGNIGLGELEAAAGQSDLASYYRLASSNVHAGPHALFFRLGLLGDTPLLAGLSNAGLEEPGQNTAISLVLASSAVSRQCCSLDAIVALELMTKLMKETPLAFAKAAEKLDKDHQKYSGSQPPS